MPRLSQVVTTTVEQEVKLTPVQRARLQTNTKEYTRLGEEIKRLEAEREAVKGIVEGIRDETGAEHLEVDGWKVTLVSPVKRGKFNFKKAVRLGISMAKIKQATDADTPGKSYIKITAPGEKEEE